MNPASPCVRYVSILALLASCTTPSKQEKPKSTAVAGLFEAKAQLNCRDIPLADGDMGVKGVKFFQTPPYGFYFGIQERTGRLKHTFANYTEGLSLDKGDYRARNFGEGSMLVGFLARPRKVFLVTSRQADRSEDSLIEIRDLDSNKVLFTSHPLGVKISDGRVIPAKDGFWAVFNKESERAFGLFVRDLGDGRWRVEYSLRDPEMSDANVALARDNALVYGWASQGKKESIQLHLVEIEPLTKKKEEFKGEMSQVGGALESWVITSLGSHMGVAAVVGDSLVGKSSLTLAVIERNQARLAEVWRKQYPLTNKHVGTPVFFKTSSMVGAPSTEAGVGLIEWVTEDAFFEAYKINLDGVKPLGLFGGLHPNSVVTETFVESRQAKGVFAVRQKLDDRFQFELCTLNL